MRCNTKMLEEKSHRTGDVAAAAANLHTSGENASVILATQIIQCNVTAMRGFVRLMEILTFLEVYSAILQRPSPGHPQEQSCPVAHGAKSEEKHEQHMVSRSTCTFAFLLRRMGRRHLDLRESVEHLQCELVALSG